MRIQECIGLFLEAFIFFQWFSAGIFFIYKRVALLLLSFLRFSSSSNDLFFIYTHTPLTTKRWKKVFFCPICAM